MKRIKRKTFKRHIDLIRYAAKRAIHRVDVEVSARATTAMEDQMKKTDWLQWCKRKFGRGR